MPLLVACLAACALIATTCGSGPGPLAASKAAARTTGGRSFRVMTFNIQHGIDGTSKYNLQRAIDVIARVQPDLVGLQEVTRNHSSYQCDDQPAKISEGLRRATGRTWYSVYVQAWFVGSDRACVERGEGDGPNTEGLAFLSPEPISAVTSTKLFNSRIALAVRVPAAGNVPIIVTHLANSARRRGDRVKQVEQIVPWGQAQGVPHVLMGDLNATPDAEELEPLRRVYRDAWVDAQTSRVARGIAGGATAGTKRIDHILYRSDGGLTVEWVETVDTKELIGMRASDHNPVVASFRVP